MPNCFIKEFTKPINYILLLPTFLTWWLLLQPYNSSQFDIVVHVCWFMAVMGITSMCLGVLTKEDFHCLTLLGVAGFVISLMTLMMTKVFLTSEFAASFIFPISLWIMFKQCHLFIAYAIQKDKDDA